MEALQAVHGVLPGQLDGMVSDAVQLPPSQWPTEVVTRKELGKKRVRFHCSPDDRRGPILESPDQAESPSQLVVNILMVLCAERSFPTQLSCDLFNGRLKSAQACERTVFLEALAEALKTSSHPSWPVRVTNDVIR